MPGEEEKPFQIIIYAAIVSVFATLITAFVKKGTTTDKTRKWAAGMCMGILTGWILRNAHVDQLYKDIIISFGAGYVTSIWQTCEVLLTALIKKYFKFFLTKKDDDIDENN